MTQVSEKDKLVALLEPIIIGAGYELVDLEWKREPGGWVLRLFIDLPGGTGGGVGLDDCAEVSRQVSVELDVADPVSVSYQLEVSSPGLERPLRLARDFERFSGREARVKTTRPLGESRRNFKGLIGKVEVDSVVLLVDETEFVIPLSMIERAELVCRPQDVAALMAKRKAAPAVET